MKNTNNQEQLYQTQNIYACINTEDTVDQVFYMVMDSKNRKNYLLVENELIEIPMHKDDDAYMPIHMEIHDLINIYNCICKSVKCETQPLKIKSELTESELVSLIHFLDPLLRDAFLQVTSTIKQTQEVKQAEPVYVKKKKFERS